MTSICNVVWCRREKQFRVASYAKNMEKEVGVIAH